MSEVVETVSKKPIAPWTKNLLVEVMVNDEDDEDVEVSLLSMPVCVAVEADLFVRSHTVSSTSRLDSR